ncbi:MAG: ion transporter [Lachnospiraceae bacterium]|nr:ion transporter [Lachnospiraceae bacterium]
MTKQLQAGKFRWTRRNIFDIIQIGDKSNLVSRGFDFFIVIVIITNITVMFLDTFDALAAFRGFFKVVELVTTLIFCIEYILRIWTADFLYPKETKLQARLHFLRSYDGVVDLLTIIPAFFLTGFVAFRMLRVVRIFHLFRINAHYDSFNVITGVLLEKKNQIFSSLFIIVVLMMASSLCIYSAEHEAQPEIFANAFSGIWWSVSTVLTVGYGDIYPITTLGKIMAIFIAFLGVGVVAIPTGIISAGFVERYTRDSQHNNYQKIDLQDIVEVKVDAALDQITLEEFLKHDDMDVYLLLRDGLTVLPRPDMKLHKDDILVGRVGDPHEA